MEANTPTFKPILLQPALGLALRVAFPGADPVVYDAGKRAVIDLTSNAGMGDRRVWGMTTTISWGQTYAVKCPWCNGTIRFDYRYGSPEPLGKSPLTLFVFSHRNCKCLAKESHDRDVISRRKRELWDRVYSSGAHDLPQAEVIWRTPFSTPSPDPYLFNPPLTLQEMYFHLQLLTYLIGDTDSYQTKSSIGISPTHSRAKRLEWRGRSEGLRFVARVTPEDATDRTVRYLAIDLSADVMTITSPEDGSSYQATQFTADAEYTVTTRRPEFSDSQTIQIADLFRRRNAQDAAPGDADTMRVIAYGGDCWNLVYPVVEVVLSGGAIPKIVPPLPRAVMGKLLIEFLGKTIEYKTPLPRSAMETLLVMADSIQEMGYEELPRRIRETAVKRLKKSEVAELHIEDEVDPAFDV